MKIWFPTIRAGSGSDVYVERLASALRERGIHVCLQWFDPVHEFFPMALRGVRPPAGTDLIHANSWNGFAFARPPIPLVVAAFHCVYRNGYPEWKTRAQALYHDHWIGRYERWSFACADAVVALTPSAAADFAGRFDMPRTTVIPGWVDTDVFVPCEVGGAPRDRSRVLIVGNASKRKGMDLLPQFRDALGRRFVITVIGGLRASGSDRCEGVVYKTRLSLHELVGEYQQTDVVASLSRYEGFGYTALEAMACGKPVVAFDVTGLRDVLAQGASGFLVTPGDVAGLAGKCRLLVDQPDLARRMGATGRTVATGQFRKSSAVDAYLKICADRTVGSGRSFDSRSPPDLG